MFVIQSENAVAPADGSGHTQSLEDRRFLQAQPDGEVGPAASDHGDEVPVHLHPSLDRESEPAVPPRLSVSDQAR